MDAPMSKSVVAALARLGPPLVKLPTLGGSMPFATFSDVMPTIGLSIVNHDNNQHSFNENIRLQNLWDGIELMAALLAM